VNLIELFKTYDLPGTPFTDFKQQIETLPVLLPDYQIIAWTPPNSYGLVTTKTTFMEVESDLAFDFMKALKISHFSCLGWSRGGCVAIIISAKHPENVDRLVVFASNTFITLREIKVCEHSTNLTRWPDSIIKPKLDLYGINFMNKKAKEVLESTKKILTLRQGDMCREFVKKIKAKTLILHGMVDHIVSEDQVQYLQKTIPNSQRINFLKGGHDIHIAYAEEFNKHVALFLNEQ
jgi:valacyclovir hydrolase